jgi:hypothetical protein
LVDTRPVEARGLVSTRAVEAIRLVAGRGVEAGRPLERRLRVAGTLVVPRVGRVPIEGRLLAE